MLYVSADAATPFIFAVAILLFSPMRRATLCAMLIAIHARARRRAIATCRCHADVYAMLMAAAYALC